MAVFDRLRNLFRANDDVPTWRQPLQIGPPQESPDAGYLTGMRNDNTIDTLLGTAQMGMTGGGWTNPLTGIGTFGRDKVLSARYEESYRIDDVQLSAMYNGNDLAKRIVDTVPREMFRRGWCLVIPQDTDPSAPEDLPLGRPQGDESGPAAPGSPLVDPMGADPANATGSRPGVVSPPAEKAGESGLGVTGSDKATPGDGPGEPSYQGSYHTPDPVGERNAKGATYPKDNRKPAPQAHKGDQSANANTALALEAYAERLGLKAKALEACIFGSLYGGGLLIVGADDGQDMSLPLDSENIKTIRYLSWVDRRFIFASTWYAEIGPKYGEVETWEIINPFGGQANTRVHESRVVRFDGAPVDFLMRRRLLGWTLSHLQAPYDTLRQFDTSFQGVSNLMADVAQAVMKINGLSQLISNDQRTLQTRMAMVDRSRSVGRMLYVDAENESFERVPTPMTGVADVLEMQMLRCSAAAEMPVAILFGREPSGLNATGDADFRRFYDVISGRQKYELEPKLRRLYTLICLAADSPLRGKLPARGLEFIWHALYCPSEKEQAEIRWLMAQADEKYVQNEILLPEEVAMSRFRNGELGLDTEIQTNLRIEALDSAELPPSGAEKAKQALKAASLKAASLKDGPPEASK